MILDKETLLTLAPDPVLARRAQFLTAPSVWVKVVFAEKTISAQLAAEPFHDVFFDFEIKKGRCNCRAGQAQICLHQLALALFSIEKNAAELSPNSTNSTNSTSSLEKLAPLEAGFRDLEIWILDSLETGLATLATQPDSIENAAARAVDGKLASIGRQLRLLAARPQKDGEWHELLLDKLASFHLAVQAFQNREKLSEPHRFDLLAVAGVPLRKDFIQKIGETVRDSWVAVGQNSFAEDGLMVRKTWLFGQKTTRFALILEYSPENQPFLEDWLTGFQYDGELVFYPSGHPQRAIVKSVEISDKLAAPLAGFSFFEKMGEQYSAALAAQPWLAELPIILENCRIIPDSGRSGAEPVSQKGGKNDFSLLDAEGFSVKINCAPETGWRLLAISGGQPMTIFGTWTGESFSADSIFSDKKWRDLVTPAGLEKRIFGHEPAQEPEESL